MRVLLDECAPKALKRVLSAHGHECRTAQEEDWAGKRNGEILALAGARFDVFLTIDTSLQYQQNLSGRKISIVVLQSTSNRLEHLQQYFPACVEAIVKIKPGEIVVVGEGLTD